MSLTDSTRLLAAALGLRIVADTTGLEADVAAKLTGVERLAVTTAERTSQQVGRIATVQAEKVSASTLRQSAAQETYNRLLRAGETDTVRLARAQAALLTARASVTRETQRAAEATAASSAVTKGDVEGGLLGGGLFGGLKGVAGVAAAAGLFATLRGGVKTYSELAGSVLSLQRATGAAAPDASRLNAVLEKFGLNGDRATQVMLRFGKNIADKPELLHKFGVEIAHNADGTVNMTKTLLNANQAFHDTPDAAQRASLALSLFGKGGQTLLPILAANRDTLKQFMDEAQQHGLIFSQDDIDRAQQLALAQKNMAEAWQGFEITLARGVVPALTTVSRDAATTMDFLNQHQTVDRFAESLAVAVGGLYAVNKGLKLIEAVKGSAIFARLFPVAQIDAAAAANERLAASEVAVGRAAAGTAALGGAAVGGGAALGGAALGGAAVGGGVYAEMAALRATIPATGAAVFAKGAVRAVGRAAGVITVADLIAGAVGPSVGSGGIGHAFTLGQGLASARKIKDLWSTRYANASPQQRAALDALEPSAKEATIRAMHGDYSMLGAVISAGELAYSNPAAILKQTPDAISAQTAAVATRSAHSTISALGAQYASSVDIFSNAPKITHTDRSALSSLGKAQTAAGDAARRVSLDEQNLARLRSKGKTSALELARAEETLRRAKEASATASQRVSDAEKKVSDSRLPTAKSLLGSLTSQDRRANDDAKAVAKLYAEGLSPDVVARVVQESATKPGTLESVAGTVTPALAKAIEAKARRLNFDGTIILGSPAKWEKFGDDRAVNFLLGFQRRFNATQLTDPEIRAHAAGVRRKGLALDPPSTSSRRRQRALSGSNGLGGF
jgi:hypothetical protein